MKGKPAGTPLGWFDRLLSAWLIGSKPITSEALIGAGFIYVDLDGESPYETWDKDGISVWNYNGEYWLVDMLDQNNIHREFVDMRELSAFFVACGLEVNF
jgi:hypothetical protein